MVYLRERGLNFSQARYKLLNDFSFIPYIRSSGKASIPYNILDSFDYEDPGIAFLKIENTAENISKFRIKKLHLDGNSYTVSLKAERKFENIKIDVLDVKSENKALRREDSDFLKIIPKFTKSTPIYVFDYGAFYFVGGYYKKDLFVRKEILKDKLLYSFLGLYFAEGGKTAASFTNSWPEAINNILDFIENNFSIKRGDIKATICCNPDIKLRKKEIEKFWTDKTGISKFFRNLHLNKNVRSPQGILELYFSSEVLKEIFLSLITNLDFTDNLDFINGFLSGDGSPILQNKYFITHHIVFDPKNSIYKLCSKLFSNYKYNMINNNRFVVYSNWNQNLFLLLNGAYSFSPMKRFKFLKYFLSLPKTKSNKCCEVEKLQREFQELNSYLINFYKSLVNYGIYNKEEMEEFISEKIK